MQFPSTTAAARALALACAALWILGAAAPPAAQEAAAGGAARVASAERPGGAGRPARPDVLWIVVDDLGAHDLGYSGSTFHDTPNLDALAGRSAVFTRAYATCQVCSPSRASLMTGRNPARHGITDYIGAPSGEAWRKWGRHTQLLPPAYRKALPADDLTVAEALKAAGYRTFFAGKWHLGGEDSRPTDHGFDTNVGGWRGGSPNGGYFDPYENPALPNRRPGENLSMRLARETTDFLDRVAARRRDEDAERPEPFFAVLSFYAVHSPIQTTRAKWKKYRDRAVAAGVAEQGFVMEKRLPIRTVQDNPVYAGLVEAMDDAVGHVLGRLAALGLDERTVVVFTSDHGGVASGDNYSTTNAPLRGGKGMQWEGGLRVPLLVHVPWAPGGGREVDEPVTGADLFPTTLALAGLEPRPDAHVDGRSFVPAMAGEEQPARPLFWHYPHYGNQGGDPCSIVRSGRWKLVRTYENGGERALFDLAADPGETTDLAAREPERVAALDALLQAFLDEAGATYPAVDPEFDEALAAERHRRIVETLLPRKEAQRLRMLEADWRPGPRWWGSESETSDGAPGRGDGG